MRLHNRIHKKEATFGQRLAFHISPHFFPSLGSLEELLRSQATSFKLCVPIWENPHMILSLSLWTLIFLVWRVSQKYWISSYGLKVCHHSIVFHFLRCSSVFPSIQMYLTFVLCMILSLSLSIGVLKSSIIGVVDSMSQGENSSIFHYKSPRSFFVVWCLG